MVLVLCCGDRAAFPVVEHEGPPDRSQTAPNRQLQVRQGQQQHPSQGTARQAGRRQVPPALLAMPTGGFKGEFRQAPFLVRSKAHAVAVAQHQLLHPAALPPQAIGGVAVAQEPVPTPLFKQGMAAADGGMVDHHIGACLPSDAVATAVERDRFGFCARHMQQ